MHIQKSVNKFCGIWAQIEARNESGKTYEDKVRDAMALYEETIGAAFIMYSLWTILKNELVYIHLCTEMKEFVIT